MAVRAHPSNIASASALPSRWSGSAVDPFVEEVFARNEATKKPWVKGRAVVAYLGGAASRRPRAGTHCIAVRAIDEYDREHHDHLIVEVTAS